jgi:polysaccharide pyruvyl transferase WcaK-like protein
MYSIKTNNNKASRYLKAYLPFWKKDFGFYGNFGHGDVGDDSAFIVACSLLKTDLLPVSKRCYAFNPHRFKGLLLGGGSVFHSHVPYFPRRLVDSQKISYPLILFSVGINCDYEDSYTEEAKRKIKKVCSLSSYIAARDRVTAEFLKELGVRNVNILPDLDLALEPQPVDLGIDKKRHTVGISLTTHHFSDLVWDKIKISFSKIINSLLEEGSDILFLPFKISPEENEDERDLIFSILGKNYDKERIKVISDSLSPQELLFAMGKYCDSFIGMRMHSVVFAANSGLPFVSIKYNSMHDGFLDMMELPELGVSLDNSDLDKKVVSKFIEIQSDYNQIKDRIINKRDYLRKLILDQTKKIKNQFF